MLAASQQPFIMILQHPREKFVSRWVPGLLGPILLVDEETAMKRNLVVPLTLAAAVVCLFFFQVEIVESHSLRSSTSPGSDASNNAESNH